MSAFWNRMTGGNEETQQPPNAAGVAAQSATVATAGGLKPAFGIAQANDLMSGLAMADNADLVVHVIRKTLESVGVQVGELIAEAKSRQSELSTQIERRRSKIEELEREIEAERDAITVLESELVLTSRTRDGLERSEAKGAQMRSLPPKAPSVPPIPRPPVPIPKRDSRESDRPTVMAVPKGLGEIVIDDGDVESILPDEPTFPPKVPKALETK
jgi:hypothetical protein